MRPLLPPLLGVLAVLATAPAQAHVRELSLLSAPAQAPLSPALRLTGGGAQVKDDSERFTGMLLGGLGGVVGGALVGAGAGFGLCETGLLHREQVAASVCGQDAVAAALVGALAGLPLGTWLGGRQFGGEGSLLATVLGTVGGVLLGGLLAYTGVYLAVSGRDALGLPLMALSLALPAAGAFVAYEVSHQLGRAPERWASAPRPVHQLSLRLRF